MTRGRLIWPFKATLAPLDLVATEEAADHDFGDVPERLEVESENRIVLSVQVETGNDLAGGRQRLRPHGNDPAYEIRLIAHYEELEDLGLVDEQGRPAIPPNHRLVALHDIDDQLVREYPPADDRKALFCVKIDDGSFGLSGLSRNLLRLDYAARDDGTSRVS